MKILLGMFVVVLVGFLVNKIRKPKKGYQKYPLEGLYSEDEFRCAGHLRYRSSNPEFRRKGFDEIIKHPQFPKEIHKWKEHQRTKSTPELVPCS